MLDVRYDRLFRTPSSESYLVSDGERPLARVELHLGQTVVFGLLLFEREPSEEEITNLIARVDEDLVLTAGVPRDDFVVSVYTGRELGVFDDETRGANGTGAEGNGAANGGNGER
jgi:hypothetical protein